MNYDGYEYPLPVFFQQDLTDSLNDGLVRPQPWALFEVPAHPVVCVLSSTRQSTPRVTRGSYDGYVVPTWADNLFGRILMIPPRLDLGNVITNQTRTIELANLYFEDREWSAISSDVEGLTFQNIPVFGSPPTPYIIPNFGSYRLRVNISGDGPAVINGAVTFDFDVGQQSVPVTGTRVVLWPFQPQPEIEEELGWKTEIFEAYDGTEQRMSIRLTPRQTLKMDHLKFENVERRVRGLLFDWLARVFAVPIWFEARRTTSNAAAGDTTINVPTDSADFKVGELCFIYTSDEEFDAIEIESLTANTITFGTQLSRAYPIGTLVMPAKTAYANATPGASRLPAGGSLIKMQFTTIRNNDQSSTAGWPDYRSKILLSDCNLIDSGTNDQWERPVTVIDNETGRLFQTSRTDRSRFRTKKIWDASNRQTIWKVRQLLHAFAGSRVSFYLPSFRNDLQVTQTIAPGATSIRVRECGVTAFLKARVPFADLRLVLNNGTTLLRRMTGSEVDDVEEVITLESPFSLSEIPLSSIERVEFVNLVRIADDTASILHRRLGDAKIEINVVSVKE